MDVICLGNPCEQWITESLGLRYGGVLGIVFGNVGGGIAKPKLLWN